MNEEIPLPGGRTTDGIVRIDKTVRRPIGAHSHYVHQVLRHLESVGFDSTPRFLGVDERGREILTYCEGDVPDDLGFWDTAVLSAAATLIRRFHDATANSGVAAPGEVVCHNDLSPCNAVFVNGIPTYLIDFDAARPGNRVRDLAYACWLWLDIGNGDVSPVLQAERLELFLRTYGWEDTPGLIAAMIARQDELHREAKARGWHGSAEWARTCRKWVQRYARVL